MQRSQLVHELNGIRAQTTAVLAELTESQMNAPGAVGEWSVKDLLAHITACEVEALTNLGKVRRGVKPGKIARTKAAVQAQNDRWYAEMKDRPLERVLADFDGARRQTVRLLEGMTDKAVAQPAEWLQGRAIGEYVAGETVEHEVEHLLHLKAWRDSQAGQTANGKVS